jgi:hypothetical protein
VQSDVNEQALKRLQSASTTLNTNTANPLPLLRLYKLPASLSLLVPVARMCDAAAAHYSLTDDCAEYLTKTLRPSPCWFLLYASASLETCPNPVQASPISPYQAFAIARSSPFAVVRSSKVEDNPKH